MRVVQVSEFGEPEVLTPAHAPDPVAGPGQVVIEVAAVPIVFVETQLRRGVTPGPPLPSPPYVPGGGVAGRVLSTGAGVDPTWKGRGVIARALTGGYAEQALASAAELIGIPEGLEPREAAALISDGPTALGLFEAAEVQPGDWVLVEAAAGGVGILLLQLARAAGARVVGATRGDRKLDLLRQWGAEAVVDYSEAGWTEHVLDATGQAGADVVFDGVGGDIGAAAFTTTARGGRFSVHGAASGSATRIDPDQAHRRGVTVLGLDQLHQFTDRAGTTTRALHAAATGRLRPLVGQTFPLHQAAQAHAAIENRTTTGRTLLLP